MNSPYEYYNKYGGGYFNRFVNSNPEFNTTDFLDYVIAHNRGDRDAGECHDIAKHEVLRLAAEFTEHHWRFPNVHGEQTE